MTARPGLEETLVTLLRTPTGVPAAATEIGPRDPTIVHAVEEVIRPAIERLGPRIVEVDADHNMVARFGPRPDEGVLILVYVVSQHANEMDDPTSGRVIDGAEVGLDGRAAVGQGATQNKGPMAAALQAIAALPDLRTGVTLGVNTEGASSHGGSTALIEGLGARGAWGIVAIGTGLRVSLGNRGRVDVRLTVEGASAHSSQPWLGANPIPAAAEAVRRLEGVPLPEPHPDLGPAAATPYGIRCEPIAPHTIPRRVEVIVDRRLLPGEDPEEAVAAIRDAMPEPQNVALRVESGRMMWPALVDASTPGPARLVEALRRRGRRDATFYSLNAFDAGFPCRVGIPTVMFGPGHRRFDADGLLSKDAVSLEECELAAAAMVDAVVAWDRTHG